MKKISVMIVDDEKLVLEDLKTLVDWEALGFEIVATAFNGKQALEKFKTFLPQVVFTDVRMPFMDGLELIRKLREMAPEVCIFLLTAYEDFTYARTAIKYGVKDYVIKSTLDEVTFAQLLKKLFEDISRQNKLRDMLKTKQLLEYLELPDGEEGADYSGMYRKAYAYIVIEQDLPVVFTDDTVPEEMICSGKKIASIAVPEYMDESEMAAVSDLPGGRTLVILDIPEVSQKKITETVQAYAREIRQRLRTALGYSFTVYVADRKQTIAELKRLYRGAKECFRRKYLLGSGGIYSMISLPDTKGEQKNPAVDTGLIQNLTDSKDMDGIAQYLDVIYKEVEGSLDYHGLKQISRELFMLLKKNYAHLPKQMGQDFSTASNFSDWLDSRHIRAWFQRQFETLISGKKKMQLGEYSRPVVLAMEYIFKHYQENTLSINEIADSVHLSIGHLCGIFKKETQKTVKGYITEVRIEEAKKLLEEGELKIYEVSLAVGYQSSQYFSQIFYKMTGTYPTNWQRDNRRL